MKAFLLKEMETTKSIKKLRKVYMEEYGFQINNHELVDLITEGIIAFSK